MMSGDDEYELVCGPYLRSGIRLMRKYEAAVELRRIADVQAAERSALALIYQKASFPEREDRLFRAVEAAREALMSILTAEDVQALYERHHQQL